MKAVRAIRLMVLLAALATFAASRGYAQSEIDPDHFDSPNTEPFLQSKAKADAGAAMGKVRFDGKVTLPYSLKCAGKRLPPGRYTVSLRSDGETGRATLNQNGQAFDIAGGRPASRKCARAQYLLGRKHWKGSQTVGDPCEGNGPCL